MRPSSGEKTVFFATLGTWCILCGWLSGMQVSNCRKNTVVSPDDGDIVAPNMYRLINILGINCIPSWFYLQDYTEMHGKQNVKNKTYLCLHVKSPTSIIIIIILFFFWARSICSSCTAACRLIVLPSYYPSVFSRSCFRQQSVYSSVQPERPLVAKGGTVWARIMAGNFA